MRSLTHRLAVAATLLLAGAMLAAGPARARTATVSVTVTPADRAAASHLTIGYLHAAASQRPAARPADLIGPRLRARRLAALAPAPTTAFDPNGLSYGTLPGNGGAYLQTARIHNVFINCTASGPSGDVVARCWGTAGTDPNSVPAPDQIAIDYSQGGLSHVTDQYVGTTANSRYPLGTDLTVSYSFSNKQASYSDILAITAKAATALGHQYAGYGDIYALYFPKGIDVCMPSACVSGGTFCAFHGNAEGSIQGYPLHLLFAVMPYPASSACQVTGGPNLLVDSVANAALHEITETLTDPDGDGFTNVNDSELHGEEIGDECAILGWNRYPTLTLNGHQYKIQLEYSNNSAGCIDHP